MSRRTASTFMLLAALISSLILVAGATAESYNTALSQAAGGKVSVAVINKVTHNVKLTLKDGSSQVVSYPPADERTLSRTLRAHGAIVKFPRRAHKAAPAVHHHIRYIAGAVLLAVIVIGGGLYVLSSRKQEVAPEPQPVESE